jgi:hypothetical protein
MRAEKRSPPTAKLSSSPSFQPSVFAMPSSTESSCAPGANQRPAAIRLCPGKDVRVGQVELALDQALGALLVEVVRVHRRVVHGHEPPAHHREELGLGDAARGEEAAHFGDLVRLHADEESVRRIRRRAAPPRIDQVVAREREQQHRGEAEREARHLHGVAARMPAQVREAVAQRAAARAQAPRHRRRRQRTQRAEGHRGEHEHRDAEAADHVEPEARVARLPDEQPGERRAARGVGGERAAAGSAGLAPDDAHRRHVLQLQERRQREAEQQHEPDEEALQRRRGRRRGQRRAQQVAERRGDRALRGIAERAAERARRRAEHEELQAEELDEPRLRRAQAAHHRAAVQVPLDEAARAERDGHAGEDRREQRGETEEALRAVDRGAHLGPAVFQVLDALAALEAPSRPRGECDDTAPARRPHTGSTRRGCRSARGRWPARRPRA